MKLTNSATNLLVSALNDIEEPFSSELEESATSVTRCLRNVLQSAVGASQANGDHLGNQSSSKVERHNSTDMLVTRHNGQIFLVLIAVHQTLVKPKARSLFYLCSRLKIKQL